MTYLISALATPISFALALGLLIGWMTNTPEPIAKSGRSWLPFGCVVFAIGVYAAVMHLIPGREGLWLETGLFLFASYIFGCTFGSAMRFYFSSADMIAGPALAGAGAAGSASVAQLAEALTSAPAPAPGPDDLTLIWGVGAKLEHTLNGMGVYRFRQIADWNEADIAKFEGHSPEFRGRVARDEWIEQCKRLASGWRPGSVVGERFFQT
jgi:predicted flap endonuclease-1-like 5' DNA nuclease